MGVTTMKMISSTSTTSTSGVTLISERTPPAPTYPTRRLWILWPRRFFFVGAADVVEGAAMLLGVAPLAQHVADQLRRHVVHVDDERLDGVGEVVERHDRRDGDGEADGGGEERLGDAGRDAAQAALARRRHRAEGVDDADDGAEEADERRRRGDRRQPAQP